MPKSSKITPRVAEIKAWIAQGLTDKQIAEKLGCTVGTLKVKCSHLGISLRRTAGQGDKLADRLRRLDELSRRAKETPDPVPSLGGETLTVPIARRTLNQLSLHARARRVDSTALAGTLLEKIAADDLFDAILDED